MTDLSPHAFWDWSCDVYGRPGAEESLLELQDRVGLDVNLLLFACWTGAMGHECPSNAQWARLIEQTTGWRSNVIEPLRAVRRYLKDYGNTGTMRTLGEKLKAVELDAEQLAQLEISGLTGNRGDGAIPVAAQIENASTNLQAYYLIAAGRKPPGDDMALLASIAQTCCGEL